MYIISRIIFRCVGICPCGAEQRQANHVVLDACVRQRRIGSYVVYEVYGTEACAICVRLELGSGRKWCARCVRGILGEGGARDRLFQRRARSLTPFVDGSLRACTRFD